LERDSAKIGGGFGKFDFVGNWSLATSR